jgi:hypothetical protein
MLLARDGVVWPIAAGAANTQGKGGPTDFSRGTCPLDQGNTTIWGIEAQNNGVGQEWPVVQIDAFFKCNEALAGMFGNDVTDLTTHAFYTSRKIDPATVTAIEGPWRPGSVTTSGTWSVHDIRDEATRRATAVPAPIPPTPLPEEDAMPFIIRNRDSGEVVLLAYDGAGVTATGMAAEDLAGYTAKFGPWLDTHPDIFADFIRKSNE